MTTTESDVSTADFFVPHVSQVRANAGQLVGLHVRKRTAKNVKSKPGKGRVVLFVHGGSVPVVPAFDLGYKDYSWMSFLARQGFHAYGMDLSGYGSSPRPMLDDPANVSAECQHIIIPGQLKAPCSPNYPFHSHTIRSDWAEIDTVVEHLRRLHRVRKVSLIGWSAGGPRAGGYASLHPGKVDRLFLFAPSEPNPDLKNIPAQPGQGAPTMLQTRADLESKRWRIGRPGQVARGVRDAVWKDIMRWDPIGAGWGAPGGVIRSPVRTSSGWTVAMAAKVKAPTLVIAGDLDRPEERRRVYERVKVRDKAFVLVESGSHFMAWEKQRHVLHAASLEWLAKGRINGQTRGTFSADWQGRYSAL